MKRREALAAAGVRETRYTHLVRHCGFTPPAAKDQHGHHIWTPEDVERLRQANQAVRTYRLSARPASYAV